MAAESYMEFQETDSKTGDTQKPIGESIEAGEVLLGGPKPNSGAKISSSIGVPLVFDLRLGSQSVIPSPNVRESVG